MSLLDRARFALDHRWARLRMSEYLDEELPAPWRARMERHLRECSECTRLLDDLRRIIDGLHHLPPRLDGVDAPQTVASVRARLDRAPTAE